MIKAGGMFLDSICYYRTVGNIIQGSKGASHEGAMVISLTQPNDSMGFLTLDSMRQTH